MGIIGVISISCAMHILFRKRIEETIGLAIMLSALAIYLIGFVCPLIFGVYALVGISAICAVFSLFYLFKNRVAELTTETVVSFFLVCFFIGFMLLFSEGRDFQTADDYTCWGRMTKSFYYTDSLFNINGLTAGHPPIAPLWSYYILKTWICYSDSMNLFAHNVFVVLLFLPIIVLAPKCIKYGEIGMVSLLLLFMGYTTEPIGYITILNDVLTGSLLFYAIYCLFRYLECKDSFYSVGMITALVCMILCKRAGLIIASIIAGIIGFVFYKFMGLKSIRKVLLASSILAFSIFSWFGISMYIPIPIAMAFGGYVLGYAVQTIIELDERNKKVFFAILFMSGILILLGVMLFVSGKDEYFRECASTFLYDLISVYDMNKGKKILPYGYYILFALAACRYIPSKLGGKDMGVYKVLMGCVGVGMVMFYGILFFLHIYQIGPANANTPSVYTRYIAPWMIAISVLLLGLILQLMHANYKKGCIALLLMLMLVMYNTDAPNFFKSMFIKGESDGFPAFEHISATFTENDAVYFVDEEDGFAWRDREFYYYIYPATTNLELEGNTTLSKAGEKLAFTVNELENILAEKYSYVYIRTIADDFAGRYGSLFEAPENIKEESVYIVEQRNDGIILKALE